MIKEGYKRCNFDPCVYYTRVEGHMFIYLLIYVDDMLIACKSMAEIEMLKGILRIEFDMKNLGATKRILGIDISRNRKKGVLTLSQSGYLKKVLKLFGMSDSKPISTPILAQFKLCAIKGDLTKDEELYMSKVPYSNAVGSLMYAMIRTRPDHIAYGVKLVSRYMSKPSKEH